MHKLCTPKFHVGVYSGTVLGVWHVCPVPEKHLVLNEFARRLQPGATSFRSQLLPDDGILTPSHHT